MNVTHVQASCDSDDGSSDQSADHSQQPDESIKKWNILRNRHVWECMANSKCNPAIYIFRYQEYISCEKYFGQHWYNLTV